MPRAETADTMLFALLPCSRFALSVLPRGVLSFEMFNTCSKTSGSTTCFCHLDGKILTLHFLIILDLISQSLTKQQEGEGV